MKSPKKYFFFLQFTSDANKSLNNGLSTTTYYLLNYNDYVTFSVLRQFSVSIILGTHLRLRGSTVQFFFSFYCKTCQMLKSLRIIRIFNDLFGLPQFIIQMSKQYWPRLWLYQQANNHTILTGITYYTLDCLFGHICNCLNDILMTSKACGFSTHSHILSWRNILLQNWYYLIAAGAIMVQIFI